MDDLEQKLGNILNDPNMMAQIMSMASSLGVGSRPAPVEQAPSPPPSDDSAAIGQLAALAQSGNIDGRERALLQALEAYLTADRIQRLEKAMRAAKMAKVASHALSAPHGR